VENNPDRNLVVTCLEDHPRAIVMLRVARNRALQIGGRWRVVFVETPVQANLASSGAQERMLRLLTLAAQMGGETEHITTENAANAAARILEEEKDKIALLIIGGREYSGIFRIRRTLSETIACSACKKHIPVEVIQVSGQSYTYSLLERFRLFRPTYMIYALCAVGVAYTGAFALQKLLPPALFRINTQNIGLLFMTACAFSAGRFGLLPGLVASVTSFFVINYFLTVPYYQMSFTSVTDLLNMGIFLFAALLISFFTSRTRGFAEKARKRELNMQVLFNLYSITSDALSRQQALEKLQDHLARTLKMDVAFFLPPTLSPDAIEPTFPQAIALQETDAKALELCWKDMKTTGLGSPSFRDSVWRFAPMLAQSGAVGVIGVKPANRSQIDVWFGGMFMAIADQVATIIEHIELARTMEATRISEEREKLRSMLLSSVSHDLKTPLASIIGALNLCHSRGKLLDAKNRATLIETALGEAERLDSFITNILDMTRLESKKIHFKQGWHNPRNIVHEVMKRLEYRLRNHKILLHPYEGETEVYMDPMMTGQVLQNVLDNACKYTPAGTTIELRMITGKENGFCYEVRDHGNGIPPGKMDQIFDKYARLQMRDSQIAGTGLGLAICKTVMEAQSGAIKAANHPQGGAVFTLHMPNWRIATSTREYA